MNTEYPGYLVDHAGIQMYLKEMFWDEGGGNVLYPDTRDFKPTGELSQS